MGVSLKPSDAIPIIPRPGILIDGLLGPGVTVVATPDSILHHRRILTRQMAMSVAWGEPFLGLLPTEACRVLYVTQGEADRNAAEAWGLDDHIVDLRSEWPRMDEGCIEKIRSLGKEYSLLFLGEFAQILGPVGKWAKEYHVLPGGDKSPDFGGDRTYDRFNREMEIDAIKQLRNCAMECGVAIVLTHNLTTRGKLKDTFGLHRCDGQIHLYENSPKRPGLTLRAVGAEYVQSGELLLVFDSQNNMLLPDQTTVRQHSPIQLNDKERKVLDCLGKHHWFMTVLQINEQTRIARATVYQKLKALSSDRKGKWVEKGADGRYRILRMS
jgi:hypothetical protein